MNDVELSVHIDASPQIVFPFLVDPERMVRWMGVTAELDARPGRGYRIDVTGGDIASGTYLEVVPDERVVFTWGWEGNDAMPPGSTTVEITLTSDGDGTLLSLRHYDLPDDGTAANHDKGWRHYLTRLEIAGSGGDPGVDQGMNS